jgi:broad specificity phosphatase PhoE
VNKLSLYILFLFVSVCSTAACGDQCSFPPDKILVVRHAEKSDFSYDSPLSIQGSKRAEALVDALGNEALSAIYTTQMIRTKQTARPLAVYKDILPTVVQKDQVEELCHILCAKHTEETVLVVGHSDTIPELFSCLGIAETVDPRYGDLFILTFPSGGATFRKSHYGK